MTDLGMPGLIGLNAGDHPLEHMVIRFAGEGCQADELQVGEARLEDEVCGDVELDRILANGELIKEVARRNREPVVGVVELVRPVELGIELH